MMRNGCAEPAVLGVFPASTGKGVGFGGVQMGTGAAVSLELLFASSLFTSEGFQHKPN